MTAMVEKGGALARASSTTAQEGLEVASMEQAAAWPMTDLPRELGRVSGDSTGPTLICVAGLHGNEPTGVLACRRVLARVAEVSSTLRGTAIGLSGNLQALAAGRRFLDRDLNRLWSQRFVEQARRGEQSIAEARELVTLDSALTKILEEAPGRVFLLDLHTTASHGAPFAILDDTLANREIALDFPVSLVLGLEEEVAGTLASYLTTRGVTVVGFEAGQHDDPRSLGWAEAAIWIALESCGVLPSGVQPEVPHARWVLAQARGSAPRFVEVRYRHPVESTAGFEMVPGFESFQPIRSGQILAASRAGEVRTPLSGRILMPLYQEQGEDGFFVVREVRPIWLRISAFLRRLQVDRALHWLPGVRRHPELPEAFLVDRRYARWPARQLFHLLGYRRVGRAKRVLTMVRRRDQLD